MKKIKLIPICVFLVLLLLLLASCGEKGIKEPEREGTDSVTISEYRVGEQIELYLSSVATQSLSDFVKETPDVITVADVDIVSVDDGVFRPLKKGITYISLQTGSVLTTYTVIVHDGAKEVTTWAVDGNVTGSLVGYVGKTYQLTTKNSSMCDFSQLLVTATTKYGTVMADDLIEIKSDGTLKVVGVGECEVWIRSATNTQDKGVRFEVVSSIEDEVLDGAIDAWFVANLELQQVNVITKNELKEVRGLAFSELVSFEETEWKSLLPSLESVVFDLTSGCDSLSTYTISAGNLEYRFVGSKDKEYAFSLASAERASLNLQLENIVLNSKNAISLDVSSVEKTCVAFLGVCKLKGADAHGTEKSSQGIVAKALAMTLRQGSNVTVAGGKGIVSSTSAKVGSAGMLIHGDLDITAISSSDETLLNVLGGDGGNGYNAGEDGGNGGCGIEAFNVTVNGYMSLTIKGGNGGNGVDGTDGTDGKGYGDGSWWSASDGGDGTDGTDGGDGGRGATALSASKLTLDVISICLTGGDSGNSGRGGDGGDGGKGANADAVGATAGDGGDGGDGGDSGDAYIGGLATNATVETSEKTVCEFVDGRTGTVGRYGYKGYAGSGGGTNGWWWASSGSSGKNGYNGNEGKVKS